MGPYEQNTEDLIRRLETLLDQEGDPRLPELRDLLDRLDRETDADPFDPAAGWADLQARRQAEKAPPRRRWFRKPLALAAALVLLAVTALAASPGLQAKLAAFFEVTQAESPLVQEGLEEPLATATSNGVTVTVRQSLADEHSIYVLYDVTAPEGEPFDPEKFWYIEGDLKSYPLKWPDLSEEELAGYSCHTQVVEVTPEKMTAIIWAYHPTKSLEPGEMRLRFDHLGYWTFRPDVFFTKTLEGDWPLAWDLTAIQPSRTVVLPAPVQVAEGIQVESLSLSPFSLVVNSQGDIFGLPVTFLTADGGEISLKEIEYSGGYAYVSEGEPYPSYAHYRFAPLKDWGAIVAVQIGAAVIPLP